MDPQPQAKVLIVDDEPAILDCLAALFRDGGFHVTTARSAREGCAHLGPDAPDLVVTDMRMETPGAGYEVLRSAQLLPHPPPVILFTAFPIPASDVQRFGVASVMMKGVNPAALVSKARELLRQRSDSHSDAHVGGSFERS